MEQKSTIFLFKFEASNLSLSFICLFKFLSLSFFGSLISTSILYIGDIKFNNFFLIDNPIKLAKPQFSIVGEKYTVIILLSLSTIISSKDIIFNSSKL